MANDESKKRVWIVLMNRVPRGPFPADEIQTMIERGLVRVTDLAYIPHGENADVREWRFLWQFPEFERRKPETVAVPKPEAEPVELERPRFVRRQMTPEEIKGAISARLPRSVAAAGPDDVIRQAKRAPKIVPPPPVVSGQRRVERPQDLPTPTNYLRRLWLPVTVLSLVIFALMSWHPRHSGVRALGSAPVREPAPVNERKAPPISVPSYDPSRVVRHGGPGRTPGLANPGLSPAEQSDRTVASPAAPEAPAEVSDPLDQPTEEQKTLENGGGNRDNAAEEGAAPSEEPPPADSGPEKSE